MRIGLRHSSCFLLATLAIGCSEDICEEAYGKAQSCVQSLNCLRIASPTEAATCKAIQSAFSRDYDDLKLYCEAQRDACQQRGSTACLTCPCDGAWRTWAENYVNCTVDTRTCSCPNAPFPF